MDISLTGARRKEEGILPNSFLDLAEELSLI